MTLALCLICHNRPDELRAALASAQSDPWDEIVVVDMASDPPLQPIDGVTWVRSDANTGVTAGRNTLFRASTADILVFLDDDAVFKTRVYELVRARMEADPHLGILAFRVVRPDGTMTSAEFPFRGAVRDPERGRPCAYFLGGAHAARRAALKAAGGYDEAFFYSTEEVDLALRVMRAGYSLWYEPECVVEHRPSLRGRGISPQVPALRLRNRIILARRHLPFPVATIHIAAWAARTFAEAVRAQGIGPWWAAWADGFRVPVERQPLSWSRLRTVHMLGGRVLW